MSATFGARLSACGWMATFCFIGSMLAADDAPPQSLPQEAAQTASPSTSQAETEPNPSPLAPQPQRPAHLVALRISAGMLAARVNRNVDGQRAISDVILGTPVTGVGRLVGKLRMHPVPSPDKACFNAVFDGTISCRTVGRTQGVTVHSHSVTRFTASKEIVFEPGKGFYSLPTKVAASTQSFTDGINPGRGGLIGRIIHRRASEQVAAERSEVTAIIRQRAVERINARFDQFMAQELAELNEAVELQTRLAQMRTQSGSRKLIARTTPAFVEIADAIVDDDGPVAPLNLPASNQTAYPVEIWLHCSLVPEKVAAALKTTFTSPDQSAIVKALEAWPGPLAQEAAANIRSLVVENKVAVQEVGEWVVIELNDSALNNAVATITASPTVQR